MMNQELKQYKDQLLANAIEKEIDKIEKWTLELIPSFIPIAAKNVQEYKIEEEHHFAYEVMLRHKQIQMLKRLTKEFPEHKFHCDFDDTQKRLRVLKKLAEQKLIKWIKEVKMKYPAVDRSEFFNTFSDFYKGLKEIAN